MLKRFLMMLLICGCLLYAPTARACEESPLPYWMDYQAFLSEYRSAIVEDRDTIGSWQLSAAAKVAGPEGTGYAFVWMDEDDVPELLIGDLERWHVWQAYTWKDGKIYNLYPEGDPGGEMWMTEGKLLYLEIATMSWSYHAWSGKRAHATDLSLRRPTRRTSRRTRSASTAASAMKEAFPSGTRSTRMSRTSSR